MTNALAGLTGSGKREKVHDAQMVTKLPKVAKVLVESHAVELGVSASAVTRVALAEYFERRGIGN